MKNEQITLILKRFLHCKRQLLSVMDNVDSSSPEAMKKMTGVQLCLRSLADEFLEKYPVLKEHSGRGLPLKTKESAQQWIDNFGT